MAGAAKRRTQWAIPILIAVCFGSLPAYAKYGGGTGEPNDPYQIATAEDLLLLGESPEDYDKHFILTADIDLDPNLPGRKVFDRAVIAADGAPAFTGVFDGDGHTISNLTVLGGSYLGLFGELGYGAMISNLGLEAADVNGTDDYIGGLVGYNQGNITNSYSTGTVIGSGSGLGGIGGLVGLNGNGSITTSYCTCSVTGSINVGGLVGGNSVGESLVNGILSNCYSTGMVTGRERVGGLVGANGNGSIICSYSTGMVEGENDTGGLIGSNHDTVLKSCWDIQSSGVSGSDGGVGLTTAEMMDPNMLGLNGFAKDPNWTLDAGRDYPRLASEGTEGQSVPEPDIDWLSGDGTSEYPYHIDTSAQLIKLSKASVLWDSNFLLCADIDLDPNLPGQYVFGQAVILSFEGRFDGDGHIISNLQINGRKYLGLFGRLQSGSEVKNLGLTNANIIGTDSYVGILLAYNRSRNIFNSYSTGTVTGNDHVGGLVGFNCGSISNSHSICTVTGNRDIGGLVGGSDYWSIPTITNCYSASTVTGNEGVGGLVGENRGTITTSYSTGTVSGSRWWWFGGLVGYNRGNITMSYSTSMVNGNISVGGLVGYNVEASITASYSIGEVSGNEKVGGLVGLNQAGTVSTCFWDIETRLHITCHGVVGCTTAEMQTPGTFLNAGWDFLDETINGSDDIWWILEGQSYPRLWWQYGRVFAPHPQDGAVDVVQPLILSWLPGGPTLQHDIYLGEDIETVANAATESTGVYRGRRTPEMTTYDPGTLDLDKTYYWRVDEVDGDDPNSLWKGNVWSFTTADFLVVDDFESYNDIDPSNPASHRIFETWIDGWNDPNNGSLVGYIEPPYIGRMIAHTGMQSMSFLYDNSGSGCYSEATMTLADLRDWTEQRISVLSLWFGDMWEWDLVSGNAPAPMYVALANMSGTPAVVYHEDLTATQMTAWTEWRIDLDTFAKRGVDLTNVDTISIGFGDKNNPQAGGTGVLYFDDIRLYRLTSQESEP